MRFAYSSTDSPGTLLTELTLTTKATARLPNQGCTGFDSEALIDSLRSSFSGVEALRSRSADPILPISTVSLSGI